MEGDEVQEKATFAAGCFWGVEAAFRQIPGVVATRVGYTGGASRTRPTSRCARDNTGHAEAVEVTYDPERVRYEDLLDVFWLNHNPTTPQTGRGSTSAPSTGRRCSSIRRAGAAPRVQATGSTPPAAGRARS